MPEAAPGLPDRKRFTPMTTIGPDAKGVFHPVNMPFVMHRHKADRAGLHHDLRIADKNSGVAHSWAYRSGKLPRVGERIEIHQQPDHTIPYMSFKGRIEKGYGKGTVGIARSGTVEVLDSTPEKLHFRLGRRRFVLVKTPRYGERSWLFIGLPAKKREKVAVHLVPTPTMAEAMLKEAAAIPGFRGLGVRWAREGRKGMWPRMKEVDVISRRARKALDRGDVIGARLEVSQLPKSSVPMAANAIKAKVGDVLRGRGGPPFRNTHITPPPTMEEIVKSGAEGAVEEQRARDRAVGQGIGSAATHFVTGYAAAPLLYAKKSPFEKVKPDVLKGMLSEADYAKEMAGRGAGFFKRHYGVHALKPALTLTGAALLGGMAKERIQAGYENWQEKKRQKAASEVVRAFPGCAKCLSEPLEHCSHCRRHGGISVTSNLCSPCEEEVARRHARAHFGKAAEVFEGFVHAAETEKTATGLLLYTNNPSERPSAPHPKPPQGFAAHFGHRFNPSTSHFRHAERSADEWMRGSAEYVDLGMRPNLTAVASEVLGMTPGKPIPRAQALKMVAQRRKVRSDAVTRRRAGVLKGMTEAQDSPEDVKDLIDALETALKHPRVRYVELTEKN